MNTKNNTTIKRAFEEINKWELEQIDKELEKLPPIKQDPERAEKTLQECLAIIEKNAKKP